MELPLVAQSSISSQIVSIGRALIRVETLVRHLQAGATVTNVVVNPETALVPMPGTRDYFDWLSVLLRNRTSMAPFLQQWLREVSGEQGGSPARRVKVLAAHLCAPPLVIDVL
jgi:hypothetical protein